LESGIAAQFTRTSDRMEAELVRRFTMPQYGMHGLLALFATLPDLKRDQFNAWVKARDIEKEYPGIRGFGYVEHVKRTDLPAFIRRQRASGNADFTVPDPGTADDLFVITMRAPLLPTQKAIGMDMGSEPRRRFTAEQAIRTGEITLSPKLELMLDADKTPGFIYMLPVYRSPDGKIGSAGQSATLRGLVFVPLVAKELLDGISTTGNYTVRMRVYEGTESANNLVFDSAPNGSKAPATHTALVHTVNIAGHALTLHFEPTLLHEQASSNPVLAYMGLAGTAISLLLTLGVWLLLGRVRAENIAREMTRDLSRLARVARHTTNSVSLLDAKGRITWVNEGFTRLTGYEMQEAVGHSPGEILSSGRSDPVSVAALDEGIRNPGVVRVEMVNRAKDGHEYWIETEVSPFFDSDGKIEGFIEVGADVTRQKTMQLRLEESMRSSQTLLKTLEMLALVSFADRNGHITHANAAYQEVSGYSLQELLGQNHRIVSSGHHGKEFWSKVWGTIGRGEPWRGEVCNRNKSGEIFWVDSLIAPFLDDEGRVDRFVSIYIDITQRKRNEEALAQATKRLELAIEGGNDGLWDWMDMSQDAQWWSPNYYKLLGYTEAELPARSTNYLSLLHPDSAEANLQMMHKAISTKQGFELEVQLRTKDRGYRWYRTRAKVYLDANGDPKRMAGATQDIHEVKLVTQALAANEAFLATAGRISGVGGWKFDLKTLALTWTQVTRDIHEVDETFVPTSENVISFYAPEAQTLIQAAAQQALENGIPWDVELPFTTAKGRAIWVRAIGAAEKEGDKTVALVGALQDVTERRAAEERLRRALAEAESATVAKGQFLANMSHEIRTPLNAILGMLSLMEKTGLSVQQEDYVTKTKTAATSLLALLNDILDLSKVEAGKLELDVQPTDMEALLRELSVILSASVSKKPLEVLYDLDARLPRTVMVDATRLKQVLINLAGNAIKFTASGEVVIRLQRAGGSDDRVAIQFSVTDTGIGISPEQQSRLFSAFTQAEASTTRQFGGTGLGLAISQQLVHMMGGEIRIESRLAQGSTFHFALELNVVDEDALSHSVTPRRVLLVDDHPVALELTRQMGIANGWDIVAVESGEAAMQQLRENGVQGLPSFDAVVVDWMLPGMDGWATAAEIRRLSQEQGAPALRIVMLTAHNRDSLRERPDGDQALIDAYLVKPVTTRLLREAVENSGSGVHELRKLRRGSGRRALAGVRLLVVEDNLINQQVAEELLTHEGAMVSLAANGLLGVQAVAAAQPQFDAVLMDVQMPVMDGYTATKHIRKEMGLHTLPIIAMTANAMSTDRAECLAAGMNEHVGKPFDIKQLATVILRLLGRAEAGTVSEPAHYEGTPPPHADASTDSHADIDMETALHRMSGLKQTYLRSARDFLGELQGQANALQDRLADPAAARMQLHTLKGTAALLGCNALAREAARLEKLCREDTLQSLSDALPTFAAMLIQTQRDFAHALLGLEQELAADSDVAQVPASEADPTQLRTVLLQLQPLLESFDLTVIELFAQHRGTLTALPELQLQALEDALQSLQLEQALAALRDALADLGQRGAA
jgi:PAS domain S-box-containing protein